MIITKRAIDRRAVLKGIGAAFALPLLDGMVPALSAAPKPAITPQPRRPAAAGRALGSTRVACPAARRPGSVTAGVSAKEPAMRQLCYHHGHRP